MQFLAGNYTLQVYASLIGERAPSLLSEVKLTLPQHLAVRLRDSEAGVYFDWGPDSQSYHAHVEARPEPSVPLIPVLLPSNESLKLTERPASGFAPDSPPNGR